MALASQSHIHPSVNEQPLPPPLLQENGPQPPHLQLSHAQGWSGLQLGSPWAQPCPEKCSITDTAKQRDLYTGWLCDLTLANQILHFQMLSCLHPSCVTLWGTGQLFDRPLPGTSLCKRVKVKTIQVQVNRQLNLQRSFWNLDTPVSSLKVSSILVWSGELPPMNSVFNSSSSSSKYSVSFCSDFLNQGPLSWSERRSGMGKRTAMPSTGALIVSDTWQLAGVWLSSRKTSVKALCCEIYEESQRCRLDDFHICKVQRIVNFLCIDLLFVFCRRKAVCAYTKTSMSEHIHKKHRLTWWTTLTKLTGLL